MGTVNCILKVAKVRNLVHGAGGMSRIPPARPGGGGIGNDEVPNPRVTKTAFEPTITDKGPPLSARTCPASVNTRFEPSGNVGGGGAKGEPPTSPETLKPSKLGFLTCVVDIKPIPAVESANDAG